MYRVAVNELRKEATVAGFSTSIEEGGPMKVYAAVLSFVEPNVDGPLTLRFESDDGVERWRQDIERLFDTTRLAGKKCWVLRSFPWKAAGIEGLEVDGFRLTVTGWLQRFAPEGSTVANPLQRAEDKIKKRRKELDAEMFALEEKLRGLPKHYESWEENLRPPQSAFERLLGDSF